MYTFLKSNALILQIFAEYFQSVRHCSECQGFKDKQLTISLYPQGPQTAYSQEDKQVCTDSYFKLVGSMLEISTSGCEMMKMQLIPGQSEGCKNMRKAYGVT